MRLPAAGSASPRLLVVSGPRYRFDFPGAIAAAGTYIWIANGYGGRFGRGSLTELNTRTGRLVRSLSGDGINGPVALAVSGDDLWVLNDLPEDRGMVAKLNATTGRTIWTAGGDRYGFSDPDALAVSGDRLWVTNLYAAGDGGSVTVLDARTGRWIKTLSGGCLGFYSPARIVSAHHHIWVANSYIDATGGSVTELSASDGQWIRALSGSSWIQNLLKHRLHSLPDHRRLPVLQPGAARGGRQPHLGVRRPADNTRDPVTTKTSTTALERRDSTRRRRTSELRQVPALPRL